MERLVYETPEMLVVRTDGAIRGLTVKRLLVFKKIADELGDRRGRVDYNKIGESVGMSANGVKYAVGGLLRANLLGVENGELFVKNQDVIIEEKYGTSSIHNQFT